MSDYNSSPYDEDEEEREGRVAIQSTHLQFFKTDTSEDPGGLDPSVPYEDELAHDSDGHLYVLTRDPTTKAVIPVSGSKKLREEFDLLKSKGVFANAEAFLFNRQINILYFDSARLTVKSRDTRTFNPTFRYYAIRGIDLVSGGPDYFSGVENVDGSGTIQSYYIDMKLGTDADGNPCSILETGSLLKPLVHGNNYIVEFYDAEGIIQDLVPFQAYGVKQMTYDMTPDMAVVDLVVTSNSMVEGQPFACSLRVGQSVSDLGLMVQLKYANDFVRDVTHEEGSGPTNRLHIEGLSEIDTSIPTGEGGIPQSFRITYFLSQASVTNPQVNPENLSITKDIKVYILPDINDEPKKVVLGLWQTVIGGVKKTNMKIFTLNAIGENKERLVIRDITNRLKFSVISDFVFVEEPGFPDQSRFESAHVSGTKTFNITVPYATSQSNVYSIILDAASGVVETRVKYLVGTGLIANEVYKTIKRVVVGSTPFLTFDNIVNPTYTIPQFKTKYTFTDDSGISHVPTHFSIKSARNPVYFHSDKVLIESMNTNFPFQCEVTAGSPNTIMDKVPVIVEFYKIVTEGNVVVSSFVTGADLFYITN